MKQNQRLPSVLALLLMLALLSMLAPLMRLLLSRLLLPSGLSGW
jgi:hypothetical protein